MGAAKLIPRQGCRGEWESTSLTHRPPALSTTKAGLAECGGGWDGPQSQGGRQKLSDFSHNSVS